MNHVVKQKGFTLIELMLAMTFISILLLAIAMTIIQIGTIYNRGMTLKEVNQVSRSLNSELSRGISSSEAFSLSTKYVLAPNSSDPDPAGARLCLGQYSYIWNYGKAIQDNSNNLTKFENNPTATVRFVKIPDAAGIYCAKNGTALLYKNIRAADAPNATELLKSGDRTLTMHQFSIRTGSNAADKATGQQLYSILYTIGTGDVKALTTDRTTCLPPNDPNADFAYCTVQQFSLVVRAGDRVN